MPDVHIKITEKADRGRVVTVTLDNQEKLNCVNTPLLERLRVAIESFNDDENLRLMILTGAGSKAFIGGADIREMVNLKTPEQAKAFITRLHEVCVAIRGLPVPVIARINGFCLGAGLEIAAACDLRIATDNAVFGMPEVKVGLPSVIEACLLPRLMGWGKARELVYTGLTITAAEALSFGLVERLAATDKLDEAVEKWVEALIEAGPRAIRLQKILIREWEKLPIDEAIAAGIEMFGRTYETDEPNRLMRRFLDRRR